MLFSLQFLAAMIQPGGGRNDVPQRLKRQFAIFNCTLPTNYSIDKIFSVIGCGHYCSQRGFKPEIREMVAKLVPATRRLWQLTKVSFIFTQQVYNWVFIFCLKSQFFYCNSSESSSLSSVNTNTGTFVLHIYLMLRKFIRLDIRKGDMCFNKNKYLLYWMDVICFVCNYVVLFFVARVLDSIQSDKIYNKMLYESKIHIYYILFSIIRFVNSSNFYFD